jgi:FkbM family methyltransferase
MKKIFIDCGTHLFQGFEQFAAKYNIDQSWECHSFEANPITFEKSQLKYKLLSKKYNIKHYNKALSNDNGKVKINCINIKNNLDGFGKDFISQGSNILNEKITDGKWEFEYMEGDVHIDSINFSQFLANIANKKDFVLIKMDIEGSEYPIIDQIIETGSYKLINDFYCEFHSRFFENKEHYDQKEFEYIDFFNKNRINFEKWI